MIYLLFILNIFIVDSSIIYSKYFYRQIKYIEIEGFRSRINVDLNKRTHGGYDERFPIAREYEEQINDDEIIYQLAENMMKLERMRILQNKRFSIPLREKIARDILEKKTSYIFQPFNGGLLDDWDR